MQVLLGQAAGQIPLQPARLSDQERAQIYQRVLGAPGDASAEVKPNRDFEDLWLRFVSSVAQLGRQDPLKLSAPLAFSSESARAAARDLAAKVAPLVQDALTARDQLQVIDQASTVELGGAVNAARYRTM